MGIFVFIIIFPYSIIFYVLKFVTSIFKFHTGYLLLSLFIASIWSSIFFSIISLIHIYRVSLLSLSSLILIRVTILNLTPFISILVSKLSMVWSYFSIVCFNLSFYFSITIITLYLSSI